MVQLLGPFCYGPYKHSLNCIYELRRFRIIFFQQHVFHGLVNFLDKKRLFTIKMRLFALTNSSHEFLLKLIFRPEIWKSLWTSFSQFLQESISHKNHAKICNCGSDSIISPGLITQMLSIDFNKNLFQIQAMAQYKLLTYIWSIKLEMEWRLAFSDVFCAEFGHISDAEFTFSTIQVF